MTRTSKLVALTIAMALTITGAVFADTPPTLPKSYTLTDENIREKFEEIGFEYTRSTREGDTTFHYFKVRVAGIDYPYWAALSPNKTIFWVNVDVVKIANPNGHTDALLALLKSNQTNGMVFFKYVEKNQMLTLTRGIENKVVTNRELREKVESVINTALATQKDWNIDWTKPPARSITSAAK